MERLFRFFGSFLKILFGLLGFTLGISANNFAYFLSGFVINVLGSFFHVFPTFSCSFLDVLNDRFFWFHFSGFFGLIFSFFHFPLNISLDILSAFLKILGTFFEVFLGFSGLLLDIGSCHFMKFLSSCLINVMSDFLDLLPALGNSG